MFRDSYFRANLKSVTKRANEMADSLARGFSAFVRVVAPRGWSEGVDKNRFQKMKDPSLVTYLTIFLMLVAIFLMVLPYSLSFCGSVGGESGDGGSRVRFGCILIFNPASAGGGVRTSFRASYNEIS